VLPLCALRDPFCWVGLVEFDEVQFTAIGPLDRLAECTAHLTKESSS